MKKTFFFLAMLASVATSATVTVTPLSTDYAAQKVTFKVAWTSAPSAPYNNRVWIWIDFCPVTGTQPAVAFSPATITNADKAGGNGSITGLNGRGFFIAHDATNAGTTVTATLSNAVGKFNWCAYASDYPPNVTVNNGTYTLHGTPPFTLIAANGTTTQTVTGNTLLTSDLTIIPTTIKDRTECPGVFCPYQGSDLYIDDTHLCQQRTSGAKNWEAYIKDSRDNVIYRIAQFADNSWWMAESMSNADKRIAICSGRSFYRGSNKPACPTGWTLPTTSEVQNSKVWLTNMWGAALSYGDAYNPIAAACTASGRYDWMLLDCVNTMVQYEDGSYGWNHNYSGAGTGDCSGSWTNAGMVRCKRQL
jgi:hypothetical protein